MDQLLNNKMHNISQLFIVGECTSMYLLLIKIDNIPLWLLLYSFLFYIITFASISIFIFPCISFHINFILHSSFSFYIISFFIFISIVIFIFIQLFYINALNWFIKSYMFMCLLIIFWTNVITYIRYYIPIHPP